MPPIMRERGRCSGQGGGGDTGTEGEGVVEMACGGISR